VALDCLSKRVKPLSRAICLSVDRSGPWWTRSLMEKPASTKMKLSDVRVIMAIMCVHVGELLCQAVTGGIHVVSVVTRAWGPIITSCHARH
jgi:hypothetical protein